jgi:hypothetical protein
MNEKTSKFAERLKDKLAGSSDPAHAYKNATELVDSQLEMVSGGGGHASHESVITDSTPTEGKQ